WTHPAATSAKAGRAENRPPDPGVHRSPAATARRYAAYTRPAVAARATMAPLRPTTAGCASKLDANRLRRSGGLGTRQVHRLITSQRHAHSALAGDFRLAEQAQGG